ncbi:MAG: hypothetical protein RLZZ206_1731 [Cyanobacteriota bacterium]|jgi:ribosome-associated protein
MEAGREGGSEGAAPGDRTAPDADPALALGPGLALVRSELSWRFSRASGPGGQNVNKTDSRVELRFPLATTAALPAVLRARALGRLAPRLVEGELVVVAEEHRSQWRNRQAALERLRELLRQAIAPPPPPRRATRPSRGAVERRLVAKRQRAGRKAQRRGGLRPEED